MRCDNFTFKSGERTEIFVYHWMPEKDVRVKGVVQIAHGMAETAARYERFAEVLVRDGYIVYANDHRGHGKTAGSIEKLGILAEADGFEWMVRDMYQLTGIIKKENPKQPIFLFGHSMGSFVTQRYIMLHGRELRGAILSGSNGKQGMILNIALGVAKREVKKNGRNTQSHKLNKMTLGSSNKMFAPNRTDFDWLSTDNAEVDKYIQNPFCGTVFTAGFFYDFLSGLKVIEKSKNVALVPKNLPLYIFSGVMDPVGKCGKGVKKLYDRYKKIGIKDVTLKLYEGKRHEMLNEINRDEVMRNVVIWLDKHN